MRKEIDSPLEPLLGAWRRRVVACFGWLCRKEGRGKGERAMEHTQDGESRARARQLLSPDALPDDVALVARLLDAGQEHLFQCWGTSKRTEVGASAVSDGDKSRLLKQLWRLENGYPGGLGAYVDRAKTLLERSAQGKNPYEGCTPAIPVVDVFPLSAVDGKFAAVEKTGREAFGKCACVLVAGGLGERLGYSGIKVALPSETTSMRPFLSLYCAFIKSLEGRDSSVPFVIMTSDDTHSPTLELLKVNDYFGLQPSQVTLLKQEKVASVTDYAGRLALAPDDPFQLVCKPHGHGDVHLLLYQTGIAQDWVEKGKTHVLFFQDTNPMSFRTLIAALGNSVENKYQINSVSIPRRAKAAAGALMRLIREDNSELTVNVEYNFVDDMLRSTISKEGDVNDPETGYSAFPGNTNQLVFALKPYVANLQRTGGVVPEFINPKFEDAERKAFKPVRLECMMQDFPLCLESKATNSIGVTVFTDLTCPEEENMPRLTHRVYAPAKNNLRVAAKNAAKGIPDACAASTELSIYACNSLMLRNLGCTVDGPQLCSYGGVKQPEWPHVVFSPHFAPVFSDLQHRITNPESFFVSSRSSLVLDGDIRFNGPFNLDGALHIYVAPGTSITVSKVDVTNAGASFVAVGDDESDEVFRIRGFKPRPDAAWCRKTYVDGGHHQVEISDRS
mmetsp:Transcript_1042/g.1540  ORF Transcript_1042/g.1540 Transcript_1042/m.1540 type:complete len:675 (-) Transcript_1042:152-2176(-)